MLIKLLTPVHPTILFGMTYRDLPVELDKPLAWRLLFVSIIVDKLDPPEFIHALDKATWIPSILQEITFNVATLTVSCLFVDGSCEEWPVVSPACLEALQSVISDMTLSLVETEKELEQELMQTDFFKQQSLNSPST